MIRGEHYHAMLLLNIFKGIKEFCHFSPVDPGLVTFHHQAEQHRLANQNIVTYNSECAHGGLSLWVGWLVVGYGSGLWCNALPRSCFFNMQGSEIPSSSKWLEEIGTWTIIHMLCASSLMPSHTFSLSVPDSPVLISLYPASIIAVITASFSLQVDWND